MRPDYGMGFYVLPNGGYGHGGGAPGINGELHILPQSGYVLVALVNRDPRMATNMVDFLPQFCRSAIATQTTTLDRLPELPMVGVDPKLETLKIETNCSERRFGWQVRVFRVEFRIASSAADFERGERVWR